MKHKTLRTLLCVILTVCFCLSAIAPVSAAGLFSGDTGAASIFDEWIRSLKDRFTEKNPGTDETPAEPMAGAGEEFIRIFHLDCGRRYFTVDDIKGIIDTLEAKKYTHIELAFGNDGLRFLLDDMSVTANGKEYSNADVTAAIQAGNRAYYSNGQNELSEADMNTIIAYANEHHISVIPLINMPGHSNALITAMAQLFGVNRNSLYTYENSNGGQAFKVVDNEKAVAFATALAKKYVDYFSEKGSEYFNIGADECGYTESVSDNYPFEQTIASDLLIPMAEYIIGNGMKPMMFNDGFNTNDALQNALTANTYGSKFTICYWDYSNRTTADDLNQAGFGIINTHNKWYYVAGNENNEWFGYGWAKNNLNGEYKNCSVCDSGFTKPNGCMLAYWCDKPTDAKAPKLDRVKELIGILSDNNKEKFTGNLSMPAKPAISGVPASVQISDGTVNVSSSIAARWTSSNNSVITFEDAATKAAADSASYTETATARIVGAGTAIITATTANRGWAVQTVTVTNNGGTVDPGTEYDNRNVTVTAGGTTTDTITGTNYAGGNWSTEDSSIATISVTGKDASATDSYTSVSVKASELAGDNTTATATEYYTSMYNQYVQVYAYKQSDRLGSTSYIWGYMNNRNKFQLINYSSYGDTLVSLYKKEDPTASTTVTFTGAVGAAGKTTYAIVGNVRYTINVIAENLSGVTPLPIQLWQTNTTVEPDATYAGQRTSGAFGARKPYYVNIEARNAYGENGVALSDVLPNNMSRFEYDGTYTIATQDGKKKMELVIWSGRVHNNNNFQQFWATDYSNSGDEFNYIRYYGGVWQVSKTREIDSWITVTGEGSTTSLSTCSEQLAVYYMMRTEITKEVTTDIADWGFVKGDTDYADQVASNKNYVLLDFAVKYQDGTRNPNDFPKTEKTLAFHCNSGSSGVMDSGSYRQLNNFRAFDTSSDYEVYMVTVTMTEDAQSSTITNPESYKYNGQEKLIWAIDAETRANSELTDYTAITSGDTTYSFDETRCIGGDPYVRGVEVYNEHGALITYYVRAKQLPNQTITVHYIDKKTGDEFYNYNILVKNGVGFDPTFSWDGNNKKLVHNTVVNSDDFPQTINHELKEMLSVPARYRRWNYECVEAKAIATDNWYKDAYIYYDFDNTVAFVMDFGLPMKFTPLQVNANLAGATISDATWTSTKYGDLKYDNTTKEITYTLHDTLDAVEKFTLYYTGTIDGKEASTVEYEVSIIPATNVLYEENFITNPKNSGWTNAGSADSVNQTLEEAGKKQNVYGYDTKVENYYLGDEKVAGKGITYSMGGAYKATLAIPEGKDFVNTPDKLTFTFKGTGFDLISGCGANTGMLTVNVLNSAGKRVKTYVVDTYLHGDETIIPNGKITYQVPVVRNMSLTYDTYTVTVYGSLWDTSGAVTKPEKPTPTIPTASTASRSMDAAVSATVDTNSVLRDMLDACGLADVSLDEVELVYMDENSILNGGAGEKASVIERAEKLSSANIASLTAEGSETAQAEDITVWVDAFRVYNPSGTADVQAYTDDKEAGVTYSSLYDYVKENKDSVTQNDNAVMYIEYNGSLGIADIASYKKWGPENEIYLAPGTAIAFGLATSGTDSIVQISAKVVSGDPTIKIGDDATITLNATEMYYDLKTNNRISSSTSGDTYIVIENISGESVLAVSGLKLKNATTNAMSETTKTEILKSFAAKSSEGFEPTVFEVSVPQTARKNRNFAFGVSASANDVQSVTIQMVSKDDTDVSGEIFTLTPSNTKAVASGFTSNYSYSKVYKVKEAGTYTFAITAYGVGGSKTITKTVVVK